ncbi:palmitoyltransferase akr1 [Sporothrix epigloea]|uniref:Palmitoyltransferase n=1 Tax=Sporothrix epigloea TaxID=1892477 RepID=A0ABP0DPE3_9PEZI
MPPSKAAPAQPAAKGSAAAPKLDSEMELGSVSNGGLASGSTTGTAAADEPSDIMHLARVGDVPAMEALFAAGEFDATYTDAEGITPLHWAAINNQYAMCTYLLDHGAPINQKGGESVATPLQWAAQRCHYYTVHLLLQRGADPLITDSQGYNTLHISTFNGNVLLLVLLLHQGIPVDVLDGFGHTGLMWSAYKGFPQCVDLFLRWGASVEAQDEQGFTALHWALVKGSPGCIQKLLEYGSDRFAQTHTGKTPAITAQELNTVAAWHRALRECGYDEDGNVDAGANGSLNVFSLLSSIPGAAPLVADKRWFVTRFLYLWPFAIVLAMVWLLADLPIYLGPPLSLAVGYGMLAVAQQVVQHAPPDMRQLQRTPWLSGIFAGSLFLVGVTWLFRVLPETTWRVAAHTSATSTMKTASETIVTPHWLLNFAFGAALSMTTYYYVVCMVADPGFVPKLSGVAEQKQVIEDLLAQWKFDEANFCVPCMIRTPLRSKHCRRCQRCVAKHDHHCPWVYNCVGVNNHRHFFLYLISLTIGVLLFDMAVYYYVTGAVAVAEQAATPGFDRCNLLSPELCVVVNAGAFTLLVAVWATLQLSWVSMLLFVQFVQVSRAMTTYENMYGVNPHGHGHGGVSALQSAFTSTGAPLNPAAVDGHAGHGHGHGGHGHSHGHSHNGFVKQWSKVLGIDTFIETATGRGAASSSKKTRRNQNPYSRGCATNCRDFWCDPAPLIGQRESGSALLGGEPVNYMDMYETPRLMEAVRKVNDGTGAAYEAVAAEEV